MSNDSKSSNLEQSPGRVGFGMVRKDVFRDPNLPPHVKLVYVCLTTYADGDRKAFPSRETIARDTGLSVRAVGRAVKHAEALGLLTITHTQTSNRYVVRDYTKDAYQPGGLTVLPEEPDVPSGKVREAHEQDQPTRPEIQTSSTSSDAYAAGAPRTSSRGDQKIRIFPLGDTDSLDDGELTRRLVKSSISALRAAGLEPRYDAANRLGSAIKNALEAGADRAALPGIVETTLRFAGTSNQEWGWLAERIAS